MSKKFSNIIVDFLYFYIIGFIFTQMGLTLVDWKLWVFLVVFAIIDELRWYLKKSYDRGSKEDGTPRN